MISKYNIIDGKKWFYPKLNNKIYKLTIGNNKNNLNRVFNILDEYLNKAKKYQDNLVGIDFEFNNINNKRHIAMCQINLENTSNDANIIFFYPKDLNSNQMKSFKRLLTTDKVTRILHGAESLDIPYLFDNILKKNSEQHLFGKNLIDTKYMCEYYHLKNNIINERCKINYLIKQMNVMTLEQFDYLEKMEKKMGPIYNVIVDINKLNDLIILYTLTDVLYLPTLIKKFPNDIVYRKLIPEINHFNIILKRKTNNFEDLFQSISKYNTNYLKYQNNEFTQIITLVEMYYNTLYFINDEFNSFPYLIEINYFKKMFEVIIKFYLYNELVNNFEVWSSNTVMTNKQINLNEVSKLLNKYETLNKYFSNLRLEINKYLM